MGALSCGGLPSGAFKGCDPFSDKEAVSVMNPAYQRAHEYDTPGCVLFQSFGWEKVVKYSRGWLGVKYL